MSSGTPAAAPWIDRRRDGERPQQRREPRGLALGERPAVGSAPHVAVAHHAAARRGHRADLVHDQQLAGREVRGEARADLGREAEHRAIPGAARGAAAVVASAEIGAEIDADPPAGVLARRGLDIQGDAPARRGQRVRRQRRGGQNLPAVVAELVAQHDRGVAIRGELERRG